VLSSGVGLAQLTTASAPLTMALVFVGAAGGALGVAARLLLQGPTPVRLWALTFATAAVPLARVSDWEVQPGHDVAWVSTEPLLALSNSTSKLVRGPPSGWGVTQRTTTLPLPGVSQTSPGAAGSFPAIVRVPVSASSTLPEPLVPYTLRLTVWPAWSPGTVAVEQVAQTAVTAAM
jgi:hypothetical protein